MKKTLLEAAAGVAGGILGTLLIRQMAKLGGKLPQRFQPRMHRDPADAVLSKAEALAHRPLAPSTRERLKPWLSFLYGTTGPLVLGLTARRLGGGSFARVIAAGVVMGAIVWSVGYLGWMPMAGVLEPIHRQRFEATAQSVLGHALYGAIAALPVAAVERFV